MNLKMLIVFLTLLDVLTLKCMNYFFHRLWRYNQRLRHCVAYMREDALLRSVYAVNATVNDRDHELLLYRGFIIFQLIETM